MNKYYCLLLNNCYDNDNYHISLRKITMFPNILLKEYQDLSNIKNDFLDLDSTIIEDNNSWHVFGSFPVIGILKEDKIYDLITGKYIPYTDNTKNINGLSYQEKHPIKEKTVSSLLKLLDGPSADRYTQYLDKIEKYSQDVFFNNIDNHYYLLVPKNINIDIDPIIALSTDVGLIDTITKTKIFNLTGNMTTTHLSYLDKKEISDRFIKEYLLYLIHKNINNYINNINKAKNNTHELYQYYLLLNQNKLFKDRITNKLILSKKCQKN